MSSSPFFGEIIAKNQTAESLTNPREFLLESAFARLRVRQRGCFITGATLRSPTSAEGVGILYSGNLNTPKLRASHVMSPVGRSEGIGGQHGYPRWADYYEFRLPDGPQGEKRVSFQAMSVAGVPDLIKSFELTDSSLTSVATLVNNGPASHSTSLGEHYYFNLDCGRTSGLKLNGQTLEEIFGDDAHERLKQEDVLTWPEFNGTVAIEFPAGYSVNLSAQAEVAASTNALLGMWVWKKKDSPSICFEPILGVVGTGDDDNFANDLLLMESYSSASLRTKIELK